jgi:hypothetical protein
VSIDTRTLVMRVVVWTPNCFEVENEEVLVLFVFVYQLNFGLSLRMSKGTEFPVWTIVKVVVVRTELRFELIRVVELLNSIVRFQAKLSAWTASSCLSKFA